MWYNSVNPVIWLTGDNIDMGREIVTETGIKPFRSIWSASNVPFLQQAGGELGVRVIVLAREGEPYTYASYKGRVGAGKVYIEVRESAEYKSEHAGGDLSPFWGRAEELQKAASSR